MLTKELEKLGLNSRESRVYLALLQIGEATMQEIAAKSGVKRTTVYGIIKSLKEKGLLKIVIGQKKVLYCAQNPKKIEENLKEKQSVLETIMPQLLTLTTVSTKKPFVSYFENEEGINDIYKEILDQADQETLIWAAGGISEGLLWNDPWPGQGRRKIIIPKSKVQEFPDTLSKKGLLDARVVSEVNLPIEAEIILFADSKTAIISKPENVGVIIENEKVFKMLKGMFLNLWDTLNK